MRPSFGDMTLTSFFFRADMIWDFRIGLSPHQLSNGAVDAIATDQNIAILECAILKLDPDPIFMICHTSHTLSGHNLALVR